MTNNAERFVNKSGVMVSANDRVVKAALIFTPSIVVPKFSKLVNGVDA